MFRSILFRRSRERDEWCTVDKKKLADSIEYYRGYTLHNDDGTTTRLSLKTADEGARRDVRLLRQSLEAREHIADSYRSYLKALVAVREEQGRRAARFEAASRVLDGWGAILPSRIFKEDLGDYIEDTGRRAREGQRFGVWIRVTAAVFWTGLNAISFAMKLLGKKRAG